MSRDPATENNLLWLLVATPCRCPSSPAAPIRVGALLNRWPTPPRWLSSSERLITEQREAQRE